MVPIPTPVGMPTRLLEYEVVYIKEGARQLEQRVDPPNVNITELLLEQQINLMKELIQMVNFQNIRMRDQENIRNELRVMPEKYAGTSSFHSFMAKFENCCEINGWEERDKLLMLKHSLTGDAATILWDFWIE